MATIGEVIAFADAMRPNTYSPEVKTMWLSDIEGRIQAEIFLVPPERYYEWPGDEHTTLIAPEPYDSLYRYYLEAMIDAQQGETYRYENDMALFNNALTDYTRLMCDVKDKRLPPMMRDAWIIRGTTSNFQLSELPLNADEASALEVILKQKGQTVLSFDKAGVTYEGDEITVDLSQEESLQLRPGIAMVYLILLSTAGERYESAPMRLRVYDTAKDEVIG